MVDIGTNTAILIAVITALSVIVGGLVTSGVNYLIEWQRSKREAVKFWQDKETRELELRNQAYIRFLSINENQVTDTNADMVEEFHPEFVDESVALIITHGSSIVASLVSSAYPFKTWNELEKIKKVVMKELVVEKDGISVSETAAKKLLEKYGQ